MLLVTARAQPALFASLALEALNHDDSDLRVTVSDHLQALLDAPEELDTSALERLELIHAICANTGPTLQSHRHLLHHLAQPLLRP